MGAKDLIVTPIVLMVVYTLLYILRPYFTDKYSRLYFIPAATLKIVGAISVGLIYQFYYGGGGDTFTYHKHGSKYVYEAFWDSPDKAFKLLTADGVHKGETYEYSRQIWTYRDQSSYMVVRLAGLFDILTFGTYSATAVLFALFSFSGMWALFWVFYKNYRHLHLYLALAVFGAPTVFFWGSGILKDTIVMGALGWMTFAFYKVVFEHRKIAVWVMVFILFSWVVFSIKKYVLLIFLPSCLLWFVSRYFLQIKSWVTRALLLPAVVTVTVGLGFYTIVQVGEGDRRYAVSQLGETIRVTAYDIGMWTGKDAGSRYFLGELDGTMWSAIKLAPAAINVALFRPYLWEVNNPLMLLSALESLGILLITLLLFWKLVVSRSLIKSLSNSSIAFTITFAIIFAAAVGVTSYNFGTLSRYRIPLIPFYLMSMVLIWDYMKLSVSKTSR